MLTINPQCEATFRKESSFEIFKSNGLICCVQRINWSGALNGYVAVTKDHKLYGKEYGDTILVEKPLEIEFNGNYIGALCLDKDEFESGLVPIEIFINVHGGITFSRDSLSGIEDGIFGDVWWFGFDTVHSGDLRVLMNDIDRQFDTSNNDEYRNFEYVKEQTIKLAEQLQTI